MAVNPYEAPQSRVADLPEEVGFQPIKLWSASGRVGRLRYLAHTAAASILVGIVSTVLTLALGPTTGALVPLLAYIPFVVFCVLVGIKRSHDMDWNGWTMLLSLIPLIGLIWLFKAGSKGENRYGNPPPPNTTGVTILAILFPVIALIGIAAAIAIPAYQDYTQRVQMQQP
jgi:uncharacterized membrane protein YhaH (DUF805 family)